MESKRLVYFKEIIQRYRNVRGYMDEFIRLSCAPELLQLRVFPDAKEISESMGALDAVRRNCSFIFSEDDLVICVGDGSTPRTATLFALMTNMQIVSIDPALRGLDRYKCIKNLQCFASMAEEWPGSINKRIIIVAVHSHNYLTRPERGTKKPSILDVVINKCSAKEIFVVALPCCHPLYVTGYEPFKEYTDEGIYSEHNLIRLWNIERN